MKELEKITLRLNKVVDSQDWPSACEVAQELWGYQSYEQELTDDRERDAYVSALFKVADLFRYQSDDATAVTVLKRAFALDTGQSITSSKSSFKELAAYKLGILYEKAKCHNTAAWWFRQSLSLARSRNIRDNVLINLDRLALNLEVSGAYEEAGQYYDEILLMLSDRPTEEHLEWLVPAAMFQIHRADKIRGEKIMRKVISVTLRSNITSPPKVLPTWLNAALNGLGMHYIATERYHQAIRLGRRILKNATRFENPKWARDTMHGLVARALVHVGELDAALKEFEEVYDLEPSPSEGYDPNDLLETFELWIDIARIHVARHNVEVGIAAYELLAYQLGAFISDWRAATTTRLRLYWLEQMAFVVHEMVSVWLSVSEPQIRQAIEAKVANALLQLKANLFIAMEVHKLSALKYSTGEGLFIANRRYAVAVRKVRDKPDDVEAMLELEDALFHREQIEKQSLTSDFLPIPNVSRVFKFDFLDSRELSEDRLFLDFSIIDDRPPNNGLPGPSRGTRYIGIKLSKGILQMIDLGATEQIETLLHPLIEAISKPPPSAGGDKYSSAQDIRHLRPLGSDQQKNEIDLDDLMKKVYDRIVTPFEPLKPSLLISPDGMLAALPFQALVHQGRYLIEEREVAYCHSLLQKESLSINQMSPGARAVPSITRSALLLGDPSYTTSGMLSLPGTKIEVTQIGNLLKTEKFKGGENVFEEVRMFSGAQATASRLLELAWPRVIHIAAHGDFDEEGARLWRSQPVMFAPSYRRWEQMGSSPITELDNSLIQSFLVLSEDKESGGDPVQSAVLTALELASLNLIGCHVVVLSACETGLGGTKAGAGVLGFQYALQASFAKAGLLSLWKVLDQETSAFMIDFYKGFFKYEDAKAGYLAATRKHCRRNDQPVHPYYWAAFVLLDLEYYHPVF